MKALFRLFHSCDPNLIIQLISLGTLAALIITSQGLKKKKKKNYIYYIFTGSLSESSHLKSCLASLKKKKKKRLISRFCSKSSSSVDTLFFQKKTTNQKLDLNNCFGRSVQYCLSESEKPKLLILPFLLEDSFRIFFAPRKF